MEGWQRLGKALPGFTVYVRGARLGEIRIGSGGCCAHGNEYENEYGATRVLVSYRKLFERV